MDLAELLGEELSKQVTEKLGDKKLIIDDGLMIPKHRMDEVSEKNRQLTQQVEGYDKQLKDLKKSAEGNEDLTKQIETLQKQNKEQKEGFDKELVKIQKTAALTESLREHGAKYPELLVDKFELDKIEIENKKVKDAENLFKPYREQYKDMFGTVKKQGFEPKKDVKDPQPKGTFTKEQVDAMSLEEARANYDDIVESAKNW